MSLGYAVGFTMSGQEKFQVVSAGKTLRAGAPEAVLQEAATAFSIPMSQARRLLVKGWVIKDQLSSKQVLEYRARLQKIGLRVEVFPAGKYDNQALLARMRFAQKRRARSQATGGADATQAEVAEKVQPTPSAARRPPKAAGSPQQKGAGGRARAQLEALFGDGEVTLRETVLERGQLLLGMVSAALVPGLFVLLLCICGYGAVRALWRIPQGIMAGDLGLGILLGVSLALLIVGFVAALLLWPYFAPRQPVPAGSVPLKLGDAKGLYLLLEVLAEKTGLPGPAQISLTAGVDLVSEPALADIRQQRLPLNLGLGAVASLSGNELLALAARALGIYRGKLRGVTAWLVLDSARRLQAMQWALENEHSAISASGGAPAPLKPLHAVLATCGKAAVPLVDRLYEWHKTLAGPTARLLQRQGDAWVAQLLGSESFAPFAEKWHRLVHAELVAAEINREASVAGQRLRDYPAAVRWMLDNLDGETRSNIELAMAQPGDPWDGVQAADNERIAWAEDLALQPLLQRDFSVQKLFDDPDAQAALVGAAVAAEDTRPVDNMQLLRASKESEQALQLMGEYFNQLPPRSLLPLEMPAAEDMQPLDLQGTIDWLRGKLVELRELAQRCDKLLTRGAAMQLGAGLIRLQGKVQAQEYFLSGSTPAAADESVRDNRLQREEAQGQIRQIFRVFYLRIQRAVEAMPGGAQRSARQSLERLSAYTPLAPRLRRLDNYGDILGLMIDRLSLDGGQRELVQKYFSLAAQELEGIFSAIESSAVLRQLGLDAALWERVGRAPLPELPQQRRGVMDALQAMELKCKNASAAIGEHYRTRLAQLLELCLKQERAMKVKPLRLLRNM